MKVYLGLVKKVSFTTYSQGEAYSKEFPVDDGDLKVGRDGEQIMTVAFLHGLLDGYFKQFGSYEIAKSKVKHACWHGHDQALVERALRRSYGFVK